MAYSFWPMLWEFPVRVFQKSMVVPNSCQELSFFSWSFLLQIEYSRQKPIKNKKLLVPALQRRCIFIVFFYLWFERSIFVTNFVSDFQNYNLKEIGVMSRCFQEARGTKQGACAHRELYFIIFRFSRTILAGLV